MEGNNPIFFSLKTYPNLTTAKRQPVPSVSCSTFLFYRETLSPISKMAYEQVNPPFPLPEYEILHHHVTSSSCSCLCCCCCLCACLPMVVACLLWSGCLLGRRSDSQRSTPTTLLHLLSKGKLVSECLTDATTRRFQPKLAEED